MVDETIHTDTTVHTEPSPVRADPDLAAAYEAPERVPVPGGPRTDYVPPQPRVDPYSTAGGSATARVEPPAPKRNALREKVDELFPEDQMHHTHNRPLAERVREALIALTERS